MNTMLTPGADPKTTSIAFRCLWEVFMSYTHLVGSTRITTIFFDIAVSARDYFRPTLEDMCRSTTHRLRLALIVITHVVANIIRDVLFPDDTKPPLWWG